MVHVNFRGKKFIINTHGEYLLRFGPETDKRFFSGTTLMIPKNFLEVRDGVKYVKFAVNIIGHYMPFSPLCIKYVSC